MMSTKVDVSRKKKERNRKRGNNNSYNNLKNGKDAVVVNSLNKNLKADEPDKVLPPPLTSSLPAPLTQIHTAENSRPQIVNTNSTSLRAKYCSQNKKGIITDAGVCKCSVYKSGVNTIDRRVEEKPTIPAVTVKISSKIESFEIQETTNGESPATKSCYLMDAEVCLFHCDDIISDTSSTHASSASTYNLIYASDQWSPTNQQGRKYYTLEQMRQINSFESNTTSTEMLLSKVRNVPLSIIATDRNRPKTIDPIVSKDMNNPQDKSSQYKASSTQQITVQRNSSDFEKNRNIVHIKLSLNDPVKLKETENVWRPRHLVGHNKCRTLNEENELEELSCKVRSILNKVTLEHMNVHVEKILELGIDSGPKVMTVVMLVFEKAIDEPNFSVSYARLCQKLVEVKLQSKSKRDKDGPSGSTSITSGVVSFKNALIDRAQHEYTDNVIDLKAKEKALTPILDELKICTNPERKAELQASFDEYELKVRRRCGGTVRFIGELYKVSMLTSRIIKRCINALLDPSSEDKLECLCKLLTTVGEIFETSPIEKGSKLYNNLTDIVTKMQIIIDNKNSFYKISSRIRFMLQDVIDLRKNKWLNKCKVETKPLEMTSTGVISKKEQKDSNYKQNNYDRGVHFNQSVIHKTDEQRFKGLNSSRTDLLHNNSQSSRIGCIKHHINNTPIAGFNCSSQRQQFQRQENNSDGWHRQSARGNRLVNSANLKQMFNFTNTQNSSNSPFELGQRSQFQWNYSNTNGKSSPKPPAPHTTSNPFASLSNLDSTGDCTDVRSSRNVRIIQKQHGRNHQKEENIKKICFSRSSSVCLNRGTSSTNSLNIIPSVTASLSSLKSGIVSIDNLEYKDSTSELDDIKHDSISSREDEDEEEIIDEDIEVEEQVEEIIDEEDLVIKTTKLLNSVTIEMVTTATEINIAEALPVFKKIEKEYRTEFIYNILTDYLHLAKTKSLQRKKISEIVVQLLDNKELSPENLREGYDRFATVASDIITDVPDLWRYTFEFIGPFIYKGIFNLNDLWNNDLFETGMGNKFVKACISQITNEYGSKFIHDAWRKSNLDWKYFLREDGIRKFIEDNNFEFIEIDDSLEKYQQLNDTEKISRIMFRIKELLNERKTIDGITFYIKTNGNIVNKQFIYELTRVICEHMITVNARNEYEFDMIEMRKVGIPLLKYYIYSKDLELQCLYSAQVLIDELHTPEFLTDIYSILYELDVISKPTYLAWKALKPENVYKVNMDVIFSKI